MDRAIRILIAKPGLDDHDRGARQAKRERSRAKESATCALN
jgi:methylmalonyl-CoA mutase cobalamin-binding subunit